VDTEVQWMVSLVHKARALNKIVATGKRVLTGDGWHDDNGPIPDGDWIPPMTDAEITEAALSDPDCPPTPPARLERMRRISPARFIRQKLGLTPEGFANAYDIPIDTLQAWERHETEPTPVELAYLRAIVRAPQVVRTPAAA
jgi:putative transcriptional regulator